MTKKKRIISVVVAVAVFFVMLYSALYIAAEANHDCVGENCPICYQISVCENTLKNLSLAVCAVAFAVAFTYTESFWRWRPRLPGICMNGESLCRHA